MNTPQGGNASSSSQPRKKLPVNPSLEHLQKQAKRRVKENPALKLAEAQHLIAQEYGCKNWAELGRVVESMGRTAKELTPKKDFNPLPDAANDGDIEKVRAILASGEFTQHDLDLALSRGTCRLSRCPERRGLGKLLLEHGADPDGQYGSNYGPIILSPCEGLDPEGLAFLIGAGADVSFGPFENKYAKDNTPINAVLSTYVRGRNEAKHRCIDLLIEHGAQWQDDAIMDIHRGRAGALAERIKKDRALLQVKFGLDQDSRRHGNIDLRGGTLLHLAVEFGERECVDVLLDHYADIKAQSEGVEGAPGATPLFHAIGSWEDSPAMLEHLLKRVGEHVDLTTRASFRKFGEVIPPVTPLEYAQRCQAENKDSANRKREVELLIGADRKEQLRALIRSEDVAGVARLLDEDPAALSPNLWPVTIFQTKSLAITRLLLERGLSPDECSAPRKPLHLAVYQCLPDIVELLVKHGANVNQRNRLGETPMDLLDSYEPRPVGDPDARRIREALLAAGAQDDIFCAVRAGDVVEVDSILDEHPELLEAMSPDVGMPPLSVSARSGRHGVARVLIQRGAKVDGVNDKLNTPLWFACQSPARAEDRMAVAKLLMEAGADVNRRCEDGSTALHFAAWRGPAAMVELLLAHGARSWIGDEKGKEPVDYARDSKVSPDREEIVRMFSESRIDDPYFRAAVAAIDAGDVSGLKGLLRQYPYLATVRAEEPGWYAGSYFRHPTLLHFVANNPHRSQTVVPNIGEIAQAIIDAGADVNALTETQDGIRHTTLDLVASSSPARNSGVQNSLIDLLFKNGATAENAIGIALGNEEPAAAHYLFERGVPPDLVGAAGLGLTDRLAELLMAGPPKQERLESAMSAALMYGRWGVVEMLLERGFSLNEEIVHAGTPLHHAALRNQKTICEKLIARGGSLTKKDRQWNGTPADWAFHGGGHQELSEWLREMEGAEAAKCL